MEYGDFSRLDNINNRTVRVVRSLERTLMLTTCQQPAGCRADAQSRKSQDDGRSCRSLTASRCGCPGYGTPSCCADPCSWAVT
jgi:hypothetical protein